jgi:hypothetical protein
VQVLDARRKIPVLLLLIGRRTLRLVLGRSNKPTLIWRRCSTGLRCVTERIGWTRHLAFLAPLLHVLPAALTRDAALERRTHSGLATGALVSSASALDHGNLSLEKVGRIIAFPTPILPVVLLPVRGASQSCPLETLDGENYRFLPPRLRPRFRVSIIVIFLLSSGCVYRALDFWQQRRSLGE